jgi:ribosomal protein S21
MSNHNKEKAESGYVEYMNRVDNLGIKVYVLGNTKEAAETAINVFKRRIDKFGILDEYKDNLHYTKPSLAKRLKRSKNAK